MNHIEGDEVGGIDQNLKTIGDFDDEQWEIYAQRFVPQSVDIYGQSRLT